MTNLPISATESARLVSCKVRDYTRMQILTTSLRWADQATLMQVPCALDCSHTDNFSQLANEIQ